MSNANYYINKQVQYIIFGTLEDDRKVLYKTKSIDGTKPKTNLNPNTNPIQLLYSFFSSTVP